MASPRGKGTPNDAQGVPESMRIKRTLEVLDVLRKSIEASGQGPDISDLVRYRNPETGQTWCGFGRPPNWIRGKDRERYRVR